MAADSPLNRRTHRRYRLAPMYTVVTARRTGDRSGLPRLTGHVYDISAGGARIELDEPLEPGESITVLLDLPGAVPDLKARGSVVWVSDSTDDPGPRRIALRFTGFPDRSDHDRLMKFLVCGAGHCAA